MLVWTGNILNWLVIGVAFPLALLPAASIIAPKGRTPICAVWLAMIVIISGASYFFAQLAVDIGPPPISTGLIVTVLAAVTILLTLVFIQGPERFTNQLLPPFEVFIKFTARAIMWLLLMMALVQFSLVVLRYVFGVNYIYMQESITYMHGAVFLIAAGYALLVDDHVRVDIFYREASVKRKAIVDFAGSYLFLFPMCFVLFWAASPYVGNSWAVREGSTESSGIQGVFLLKSLIPFFALLLLMSGFIVASRAGAVLKGRT